MMSLVALIGQSKSKSTTKNMGLGGTMTSTRHVKGSKSQAKVRAAQWLKNLSMAGGLQGGIIKTT